MSILAPRKPLPVGAPLGKPWILSEVVENEGKPVALALTFDPGRTLRARIADGEIVVFMDTNGRMLELRTTRGIEAPAHLMRSAQKQDKWVVITAPVEVVAWHRKKAGGQ